MYKRKRVDPRIIGGFVIGAIILGVAGLIFFGPGGLLSETRLYVLHFGSSVKGLNAGSPVRFRGVKVGQVKEINVRLRTSDLVFHIPVVIEIEPARIEAYGTNPGLIDALTSSFKGGDPIQALVEKGLRARMELDSLVTGQLYINFDIFPDTPVVLSGNPSEYPELPTITSSLGELTKTFEDLPLRELANKLINSAEGFEKLITSPSLHNGLAKFDDTAAQLNQLLRNLNGQLIPLADTLRQTLLETQSLLGRVDSKIEPISADISSVKVSLEEALNKFTAASVKTEETMQRWKDLAAGDSQLQRQLSTALQEVGETARSIRYLSSEIERDPQILLRGRGNGEKP